MTYLAIRDPNRCPTHPGALLREMNRLFVIIAVFMLSIGATVAGDHHGGGSPVRSDGTCPHGEDAGGWCRQEHGEQIVPNPSGRSCPTGYTMSGSYCYRD